MSPNEVPIPLEKTVTINGSTIEISIAEKKMSDKEKASYQKFMAKCISESSAKTDKEAAMSCAVTFERMKEKIMAEDDLEDVEEEEEDKEEDEEDEEDEEEEGKEENDEELQKSESAAKKQEKMQYREKSKTPFNSVKIITVEQLRKWEMHEKNETREDELKETKEAWRNTVDL
jgi:hypothetical protein